MNLNYYRHFNVDSNDMAITSHAYLKHKDQNLYSLDFLRLKDASKVTKVPIIYAHGGGYVNGDKSWYNDPCTYFVREGHPLFNVNYPLAPEYSFPKPIEAFISALQWIKNCDLLGQKPVNEVMLMGDSAVGSLVTMTTLCVFNQHLREYIFGSAYPKEIQESLPKIICVVNLYGTNDRKTLYDGWWNGKNLLREYIGLENGCFEYNKVTPNNAAFPCDLCGRDGIQFTLPPIMLMTGTTDPIKNATYLLGEMIKKQKDIDLTILTYENVHHGLFTWYWKENAKRLYKELEEFFQKHST